MIITSITIRYRKISINTSKGKIEVICGRKNIPKCYGEKIRVVLGIDRDKKNNDRWKSKYGKCSCQYEDIRRGLDTRIVIHNCPEKCLIHNFLGKKGKSISCNYTYCGIKSFNSYNDIINECKYTKLKDLIGKNIEENSIRYDGDNVVKYVYFNILEIFEDKLRKTPYFIKSYIKAQYIPYLHIGFPGFEHEYYKDRIERRKKKIEKVDNKLIKVDEKIEKVDK